MKQADDFLEETETLAAILSGLDDAGFGTPTLFKQWTIDDVLRHLHHFNLMAIWSAFEPDRFSAEYARFRALRADGDGTMTEASSIMLDGLSGPELCAAWLATAREMCPRFATADPRARVKWAGPDMSVRTSITARQMETWAHGQAVFDVLGLERQEADRVSNIAHLGVSAYGWTFVNRGEPVPEPAPFVSLALPSGAAWTWGEPNEDERIDGDAVGFAQVVAQTRNIADTGLSVTGANATRWMAMAQCFAGPPNDPPAPGERHRSARQGTRP